MSVIVGDIDIDSLAQGLAYIGFPDQDQFAYAEALANVLPDPGEQVDRDDLIHRFRGVMAPYSDHAIPLLDALWRNGYLDVEEEDDSRRYMDEEGTLSTFKQQEEDGDEATEAYSADDTVPHQVSQEGDHSQRNPVRYSDGILDVDQVCGEDAPEELNLTALADSGNTYDMYHRGVTHRLNGLRYYGGYELIPRKRLGGGSYGDVWLYADDSMHYQCAVKVFRRDDTEPDLVRTVNELDCPLVRAITMTLTVDHTQVEVVVMDLASGTLQDFADNYISYRASVFVLLALLVAADCLLDSGFIYTDYKPINLLYRCDGEYAKVYFGDLGGLVHVDEVNPRVVFTYPPPEGHDSVSEATMVWGIAITYVLLFGRDTDSVRAVIDADPHNMEDAVEEFSDEMGVPPMLRDLLTEMLSANPRRRPALGDIISYLS